jgi:hypothetical protein
MSGLKLKKKKKRFKEWMDEQMNEFKVQEFFLK